MDEPWYDNLMSNDPSRAYKIIKAILLLMDIVRLIHIGSHETQAAIDVLET